MRTPLLISSLILLALSACAARRIPGTEIEDTDDTRAILQVMERYRAAVEARDANAVINLCSESFRDDAGSAKGEDRIDYATLKKKLPVHFATLDDVRLDLNVRRIELHPERSMASAIYNYNLSFRMPRLSNKAQNESEIKQMWFKRDRGQWKITSGI